MPTSVKTAKINLGCGEFYAEGWVNVDHQTPHRHDVTADLRESLPFEAGSITHAYVGHVLEHITQREAGSLLARLMPLMALDGVVMVVGPDINRGREMVARGEAPPSLIEGIVDGAGRWAGDVHLWTCEAALVTQLLTESGWADVTEVPIVEVGEEWPVVSRTGWQCAVTARAV